MGTRHIPRGYAISVKPSPAYKLVVPVLFGLLVAGYPIVSGLSTLLGLPNQTLSIVFRALFAVLSGIVILIAVSRSGNGTERHIAVWYWFCLLVMWGSYSLRFFIDVLSGDRYSEELVMIGTFVGSTLVPFFAFQTRIAIPTSNLVFKGVFFFVLAGAVLNIHLIWSSNVITDLAIMSGRAGFESLNPISLAMLGAQLSILCLFALIDRRSLQQIGLKTVMAGLVIGMVVLIIGGSRGPILAFLCSLIPLYFLSALSIPRGGMVKIFFFSIALIGGLIVVAVVLQNTYDVSTVRRVLALITGGLAEDYTSSLRLIAIGGAFDQFLSSPLIGDSIMVDATWGYPHNIAVEFLMATGIVGFIPYFTLVLLSIRASIYIVFHHRAYSWIVLLYVQGLTLSMISGNVWSSSLTWCLMGSVICIASHAKRRAASRVLRAH